MFGARSRGSIVKGPVNGNLGLSLSETLTDIWGNTRRIESLRETGVTAPPTPALSPFRAIPSVACAANNVMEGLDARRPVAIG
jgi:hypothetical protein